MMSKKKKAAKTADDASPADAAAADDAPGTAEGEGEKVESEPAHVEEATIRVRGTGVGGVKMMTPSEHKAYCKAEKKKAAGGK